MTHERNAIEQLSKCRFAPGTFDKRFAHDMVGKPEDHKLTPKQRETLWKLVVKYRKQLPRLQASIFDIYSESPIVTHACWWLGRPARQIEFEQMLSDNPRDWDTRRIYADWLDDQGEYAAANAQRWMSENEAELYLARPMGDVTYSWTFGVLWWSILGASAWYHPSREAAEREIADALERVRVKA